MLHKSQTYSLRNDREIRQFLNDYLYIDSLLQYAYKLHEYFITQADACSLAISKGLTSVGDEGYAERLSNYIGKAQLCFHFYIDTEDWTDQVVEEELNFPTTIEYRDTVSVDGALKVFLDRFTARWINSLKANQILQYREEYERYMGTEKQGPAITRMIDFYSSKV